MKQTSPHPRDQPSQFTNNSTASNDRKVILKHLTDHTRLTTIQARQELGVMSPAPRVLELRQAGYKIITHRRYEQDITGRKHYQAEYVLMEGGER